MLAGLPAWWTKDGVGQAARVLLCAQQKGSSDMMAMMRTKALTTYLSPQCRRNRNADCLSG